jgi:hypothetical protein
MIEKQHGSLLFLKVKWAYIAVKTDCKIPTNIGAIEKIHQGGGYPGTLNVKRELDNLFTGTCIHDRRFISAAPLGRKRRGGGSGFIGWIDFGQIGGAIAFLRSHFRISFCPIGGHIKYADGSMVTIPEIGQAEYWVTLRDVLERGCKTKQRPAKIVLRGGGTVPVPTWFRLWCAENGIDIEILTADDYDAKFDCDRMFSVT